MRPAPHLDAAGEGNAGMTSEAEVTREVAAWELARANAHRTSALAGVVGGTVVVALVIPSMLLANAMAAGVSRYVLTVVWTAVFFTPVIAFAVRKSAKDQSASDGLIEDLAANLRTALERATSETAVRELQAAQQRSERRIANALELCEREIEVTDIVQRAMAATVPQAPAELLLADNSQAHLIRTAVSPVAEAPGCAVDSPRHCPAARRAQTQVFTESEEIDACPRLRGRSTGPCSAVCVPVSVMGRTVGVIHATGEVGAAFPDHQVRSLETLANMTGARIGLLRVMSETQLQATTDPLTGLLNRRSFEEQFTARRDEADVVSIAMADLDHFKELNDTYGHETGDRALRLFAQTVRGALRAHDLVCRYGGEEFAIALPDCTASSAAKALDALRARLDAAITVAGLPAFTVSFGVAQGRPQEDLPAMINRADGALFDAKRRGRNQVVVYHEDEFPSAHLLTNE